MEVTEIEYPEPLKRGRKRFFSRQSSFRESRWIKEQIKCPRQAAVVTHVTTVAEFGNDLLARASGCVKSRPRVSLADFCRHRVRHHPRPAVSQVSCHFTSPAASPLAAAEHKAAPLSGPLSAAALSEEPRGGAGDLTAPGTARQRP